VALRIELEEMNVQMQANDDASEMLDEFKQMLLQTVKDLYEELRDETDSQGSSLDAIHRKLAVQIIKMFATVLGPKVCNVNYAQEVVEVRLVPLPCTCLHSLTIFTGNLF